MLAAEDYRLGPDSQVKDGVPKGAVSKFTWESKIFAGTTRDCWVYVPAQYDGKTPACVVVFQDGGGYVSPTGGWRVPVVLDNLISAKEMPVTIGIFINPGVIPAASDKSLPRFNRSFEYDAPTDQYARFLIEEILPEVGRKYKISSRPGDRAIAGSSSGGICAFNVAWQRPEEFSRVVSFIGSFTNLRGAQTLASLIRKTEPKPIRVFLQDGSADLDIYAGSWWVANQDVAAALKFAGYDCQFVTGDGGHNGKHGGAILPDALRYIWKDWPAAPARPTQAGKQPVMEILIPGQDWELVSEGHKFTEGAAADAAGNVYFSDAAGRICKIDLDRKVSTFAEKATGSGLMFGPEGKLYAARGGEKRIVAYGADARETVIAENIAGNDLCISRTGHIYVTEPAQQRIWHIAPDRQTNVVGTGIVLPSGVRLTPDQSQLIVGDARGQFLYAFGIQPNGALTNKEAFYAGQLPLDRNDIGAAGMTVDTQGRLYVATHLGVQVFDQAGRVNGIICKPQNAYLSGVVFGGKDRDCLYVTCSDKVYRRKTNAKGVLSCEDSIKPPAPRM